MRNFNFISFLCSFLLAFSFNSFASDRFEVLDALALKITKLNSEITVSTDRILSSTETFAVQEAAYEKLTIVSDDLVSTNNEINSLMREYLLESLITSSKGKVASAKIINIHKGYIKKMADAYSASVLKNIQYKRYDEVTIKLLYSARDIFDEVGKAVENLN